MGSQLNAFQNNHRHVCVASRGPVSGPALVHGLSHASREGETVVTEEEAESRAG